MQIRKRYGLDLLADFYSLSTFYNGENVVDKIIADQLLPHAKESLIDDLLFCICRELRHSDRAFPNLSMLKRCLGDSFDGFRDANMGYNRDEIALNLMCIASPRRIVKAARTLFKYGHWTPSYGGEAWAAICDAWLELAQNSPSFSNIDRAVDICHNTGNVLNKLYPGVDGWLDRKTKTTDPFWILKQSQLYNYGCRRLKERYGWTAEEWRTRMRNKRHKESLCKSSFKIKTLRGHTGVSYKNFSIYFSGNVV